MIKFSVRRDYGQVRFSLNQPSYKNARRHIEMTNKEKYIKVFEEILGVKEEQLAGLEYQAVPSWDSVGHMELVAKLEDAFNVMMKTDDIAGFSSFEKGMEILKKHGEEM